MCGTLLNLESFAASGYKRFFTKDFTLFAPATPLLQPVCTQDYHRLICGLGYCFPIPYGLLLHTQEVPPLLVLMQLPVRSTIWRLWRGTMTTR